MAAPRGEGAPGCQPGGCGGAWGPLLGPPRALLPCACPCPCACPVLAACSLLPPPPGLLAQPVPLPSPCAGPCVRPPAPGRVRAGAGRESTGALRAWLRRHPRNPYPSKGEKVMLALLSRMSLTQVSTWFANARRRLRKEQGVAWAPRGTDDGGTEGPPPGSAPGSPHGSGGRGSPRRSPQHHPPQPKIWSLAEMVASPAPVHGEPPGTLE